MTVSSSFSILLQDTLTKMDSLEGCDDLALAEVIQSSRDMPDEDIAPLLALVRSPRPQKQIACALLSAPHPKLLRAFIATHGPTAFRALPDPQGATTTYAIDLVNLDGLDNDRLREVLCAISGAEAPIKTRVHRLIALCSDRGDWGLFEDYATALGITTQQMGVRLHQVVSSIGALDQPGMRDFCARAFEDAWHSGPGARAAITFRQLTRPNLHLDVLLVLKGVTLRVSPVSPPLTTRKLIYSWTIPLYQCHSSNHGKLALLGALGEIETLEILSLGSYELRSLLHAALEKTRSKAA